MPKARKHLISLEATPYCHCVSRCVRHAFLCGIDAFTGQSYEHRRQWIEDRIHTLAAIFCIDVCAYAVMSNHVHSVLFINQQEAQSLSIFDICQRWHSVFKGNALSEKFLNQQMLNDAEMDALNHTVQKWKERLSSISWFMRCLNEPIARQANKEDQCTGRFWEGRYKSQALLDESALMSCMAYVDLNPIRAKMADTPKSSEHTSIKNRIETLENSAIYNKSNPSQEENQPITLAKFIGNPRDNMPQGLPFKLEDYLTLVDWTGRVIREDKRGSIPSSLPSILDRLFIEPAQWIKLTTQFESCFKRLAGKVASLKKAYLDFGYKRYVGLKTSQLFFE